MAALTYYVVLPFVRNEVGELVAEDGIEVANSAAAIMLAAAKSTTRAGVVAFYRTGDIDTGEYGDAVILVRYGDTPAEIGG